MRPTTVAFTTGMALIAMTLPLIGGPRSALAQVGIPFPPPPPRLPEKPTPPPPPPLLPPVPPVPPKHEPSPPLRVFIHEIQLVGNTIFSDEQLEEVTQKYKGRELTAEDMEALRLELTMYYVNRGYVTSGAIIPDQAITFNVLKIQIVEGTLSRIDVEGNVWLWSGYVRNRVLLGVTTPVSVGPLQDRLQLLQRDPHIERLNAELRPGVKQGESVLGVAVKEAPLFHSRLEFNNYQSPTVGAEQGLATLEDTNLTGLGDDLSLQYGRSRGVDPILNFRYALPLNAYDTTFIAQYRRFDFAVKEQPFKELDIRNKAEIFGLTVRHPVYRTLDQELALSLIGEHEKNKSFLLGEPFEFVAGATNGVFKVSALRFAQEYIYRTGEQVFSAFSRFSLGIGVLDATGASRNPESATGRFFSWLGEAQYVRQLQPLRTQLLARTTLQLANEHLFPLEQIAVGGRYSVRGYREYTFVRDNAFIANVELRVPIYTTADGLDIAQIAPFADVGRAWNTSATTGERDTLASVGVGLIVNTPPTRYFNTHFDVYWGQQLNRLRGGEGNLQDHGVHVQFVVQPF